MTTQATFLERLREDRLDEASADQWQDEELRRLLNEGAADIARKTECLQDRTTVPAIVSPTTAEYTIPAAAIRVFRVEFTPTNERTRPLTYADVKNLDQFGWEQRDLTNSYPYAYTVWGSGRTLKLICFPAPATAGSFTVWYYRLPTDLAVDGSAAASHLEIPQGWDDIVLDYVEYRALRKDRDPRWTEAKALYDENLSTMYDNTRRWVEDAGMIVPNAGGSLPTWLTSFSA